MIFRSERLSLTLSTRVKLEQAARGVRARFELHAGQSSVFALTEGAPETCVDTVHSHESSEVLFRDTVSYWRHWLSKCTYTGRWREMVQRSALALKLLTFQPTGEPSSRRPRAACPESPGGVRNWDYRYVWVRDAAFTVYAFIRVGFRDEAGAFMRWLEARCAELPEDAPLSLMYSIDGSRVPPEEVLSHLSGYGGAKPVRIGNWAADQLQLDIYGELMDSVYLYNKYGAPISYDFWRHLRRLVDWVCDHWDQASGCGGWRRSPDSSPPCPRRTAREVHPRRRFLPSLRGSYGGGAMRERLTLVDRLADWAGEDPRGDGLERPPGRRATGARFPTPRPGRPCARPRPA